VFSGAWPGRVEGADCGWAVWKVQPFSGAHFAADPNDARYVVTVDGDNFQLNEAVIQREQITWLDGARQTGESHRDVLLVACHRLRREREGVTGLQFNLFHPKNYQSAFWDRADPP